MPTQTLQQPRLKAIEYRFRVAYSTMKGRLQYVQEWQHNCKKTSNPEWFSIKREAIRNAREATRDYQALLAEFPEFQNTQAAIKARRVYLSIIKLD